MESSKSEFPTLSSALGNPAKGSRISTFPQRRRLSHAQKRQKKTMTMGNISNCKTNQPKVTFSNCLTGVFLLPNPSITTGQTGMGAQ